MTHPINRDFLLAGKATFTIETPDQGHRTFKVTHKAAEGRWKETWFVKMLTGSDNTSDYSYVGKLDDFTGQVVLTAKSKMDKDSYAVKLLNRVLARIWADDHEAFESKGYKVHHEGQCCRCGRALTVPASIESGIGPECAKRMGGGRITAAMIERAEEVVNDEWTSRLAEKAEHARREAIQERAAFMSDPDFVRDIEGYGTGVDCDGHAYAR